MCHNDCRPGYSGICQDCGEEVTTDPYWAEQVTAPARTCTTCGELEGSYWAGKHCTYPPLEVTA